MNRPITPKPTTVGARIMHARQTYGLSQHQLSDNVGVTRAAISQYEQDKFRPRDEIIKKLAQVFSVGPEWFAYGKGDEPKPLDVPVSIPEIDLTRIRDGVLDLRNLLTRREWRLPLELFFEGDAFVSPNHLVAFVSLWDAEPIKRGDRVVVDLHKRTGRHGVFLALDADKRVFLSHGPKDPAASKILGRVAAYFRTI